VGAVPGERGQRMAHKVLKDCAGRSGTG
jgi:hypothetical protein